MDPGSIKIVTIENLHSSILQFIQDSEIIIGEYDDMKECVLKMIRARYFFNMDRDRLRDAMEDITFAFCPEDDVNKDRVSRGLEYEYSDEELSDEDDDDLDILASAVTVVDPAEVDKACPVTFSKGCNCPQALMFHASPPQPISTIPVDVTCPTLRSAAMPVG